MFEKIINFFKSFGKSGNEENKSKDTAKERLHLVLMQDRANVSADFLELMKQEIIDVIKKYIEVDENAIDVRLTNKTNEDGTTGAPALYANIPITNIKHEMKATAETAENKIENEKEQKEQLEKQEEPKQKEEKTEEKQEKTEVVAEAKQEEEEKRETKKKRETKEKKESEKKQETE